MSSSVLALLVALVSVLSFTIPMLAKMMQKDESAVTISLQGVQGRDIYFLASNSGNKPGSVGTASLEIRHGQTKVSLPLYRTDKPPLVEPGASVQLSYTLMQGQWSTIERMVIGSIPLDDTVIKDQPWSARFDIQSIEFGASKKRFSFPMDFAELQRSMVYLNPRCVDAKEALNRGALSPSEAQALQANC